MNDMSGGGEPDPGVRASDAERDATIERLSAATGDGRLTLAEFSQRMEQASAARTRAELDGLVTDLPAATGSAIGSATGTATGTATGAGTAVASPAAGPARWHVYPIGGLHVSGPWRMDRHVIVASVIGGADLDLSQAELAAPSVMLTHVSLLGGVSVKVPPGVRVERSGFSLIGGTRMGGGTEPGPGAPTVHIRSFSLLGGVQIRRGQPDSGMSRRDYHRERMEERRERLIDRRDRVRNRRRFLD